MTPKVKTPFDIGAIIRARRMAMGLTQASLAKQVRIRQQTLSGIENGAQGTSISTLLALFHTLGLQITLGDIPPPSNTSDTINLSEIVD
ncbi:MAG TPA: transcriptional regulator [Rhodospirillaceae bacterium]|jgi:HTH-type transcriptional regulator/antitoxin HipB|uniref:helix-turn-helix transcriptional regulator n=1 Tax=unclassified Hwanghaeella TaxID=2605944 RepID=UPI000C91BBD7|nr:transcriptional regulator [Rhodospirillaceae bacterium]MAO91283.1 transcriptional regulator [Rhodospirillales bacterium]MBB57612.1 transcriptional regulator [Rhodospirillaceae bacterium]HAJ22309.1 transcriptional regulator [Rhodospirillaceae bacterium]HBR42462.1 transcriptional regulator [Sulfitobacter pontiacus]|tara:strand:- start:1658 stop:1924 length:267 start_codon:yes stop_codon:yes gene_type:complete